MPLLLDLFLTFLKIGAISFGGGYGMISVLKDEVLKKGWLTYHELMNFIAVSESTPGPIAINMATFIGYFKGYSLFGTVLGGFLGALIATCAVVLPAFIIMLIIVSLIKNLLKFKGVQAFLSGVRPVVIGLIIATGLSMILAVIFGITKISGGFSFDFKSLIIITIIFIVWLTYKLIKKKNISPILLIVISAPLGIVFYGLL
ncbi:MAG: chromate transporter [Clostridia bacterium]|nr:chromate transporter [Clostridia bacterium]